MRRWKDFLLLLLRVANLRHVLHLLLMMVLRGAGEVWVVIVAAGPLRWVALLLMLTIWVAVLSWIEILTRVSVLLLRVTVVFGTGRRRLLLLIRIVLSRIWIVVAVIWIAVWWLTSILLLRVLLLVWVLAVVPAWTARALGFLRVRIVALLRG